MGYDDAAIGRLIGGAAVVAQIQSIDFVNLAQAFAGSTPVVGRAEKPMQQNQREAVSLRAKMQIHIFIFVKDEPGVLSKLTTTLYENSINIKDIELLKIREGTGGTFRLSLESEEDAGKARKLIEGIGFKIK